MLLLGAAACSSVPTERAPEDVGETGGTDVRIRIDDRQKLVAARPAAHVEGHFPRARRDGETHFAATTRFLREHAELFPLQAAKGARAAWELRLVHERVDELGMHHVRARQTHRGIEVRGAEVMAHFDAHGALRSLDTNLATNVELDDITPKLSSLDAEHAARTHYVAALQKDLEADGLRAGRPSDALEIEDVELVIDAPDLLSRDEETSQAHAPRLAYHMTVRGDDGARASRVDYTIDAKTGAVLNVFDNIQTVQASSKGALGDNRTFEVTQSGATYQLIDLSRTPNGIKTYTANGSQSRPGTLLTAAQPNAVWDGQAAKAPGAAVDAHFFAGVVYDFYKARLARNGINGADAAIISTAHFGQNYANAFWDGNQMTYGDGDNVVLRSLAAGLDVIAHELTHGVTQFESNLTYQNQSGALNEAMSDIMASYVEAGFQADPVKNWQVGEVVGVKGPLRDMAHPGAVSQKQPTHMQEYINTTQDNGGVHINSGIVNNAAYLMTVGGTNDRSKVTVSRGLGAEKGAKLWYRMNQQYLMASSNFKAAADASMTAATDLAFTTDEQNIIDCAWKAVGVRDGACNTIAPPAPGSSGGTGTSGGTGASGGTGTSSGTGASGGTAANSSGATGTGEPESSGLGLEDRPSSLAEDNIVGCSIAHAERDKTSGGELLSALFGALAGVRLLRRLVYRLRSA